MKRTICVITGSRAEYGHLFWLMKAIAQDKSLKLQLAVTGMHLSSQFGLTYKVILKDGFKIDAKVPILKFGNSPLGIAKSVGKGCSGFADAFGRLKPDLIVICGDRYEMLSAAIAAHVMGIPIAHLHGGENSQGAIDEALRHSISKMSYMHFAATEDYRKRIIQLGEDPQRVYYLGAPGLDHLHHQTFLSREQLAKSLGFDLSDKIAMVTFHPLTLGKSSAQSQIKEVLKAIQASQLKAIFTKANADAGGVVINRIVEEFCRKDPQQYYFTANLGSHLYFNCLKNVDVMVGNSSSGIVESASFHLPVVNIGDRQKGRFKAANVIDIPCQSKEIQKAIAKSLSAPFHQSLRHLKNPYVRFTSGDISTRIKDILKKMPLHPDLLKKSFYDISFKVKSRST